MAFDWLQGILGGAGAGFLPKGTFFGKNPKIKPLNKDVMSALMNIVQSGGLQGNPLYGSASSHLQNLLSGSPEAFEAFEAPFKQQFERETVPALAERFAGLGTGSGALGSSSFQQSLGQAGKDLSTNLAALRGGLQQQGLGQALQFAQQPISNQIMAAGQIPGQYLETPGTKGLFGGGNSQGLIQLLMALMGGG